MQKTIIHSNPPGDEGEKALAVQIPSNLAEKNPIIDEILQILQKKGFLDEEDEVWSRLCLDEILVNAIKHGNKEDIGKKVSVTLFTSQNQWSIRVEDEGEGFDPEELPQLQETDEYWEAEHGRGIILISSYMDEIWYYDKGNRVQLTKSKKKFWKKMWDKIAAFLRLK